MPIQIGLLAPHMTCFCPSHKLSQVLRVSIGGSDRREPEAEEKLTCAGVPIVCLPI